MLRADIDSVMEVDLDMQHDLIDESHKQLLEGMQQQQNTSLQQIRGSLRKYCAT